MGRPDERVTALQSDMAEMRQEWEVVRRTPAAQTRLLNAMRTTQLEHGRDIAQLKTDMAGVKVEIAGLKLDVAELKGDVRELKLDVRQLKGDVSELKLGMGTVVGMLTTLIEREAERG